ncbi:sodium:alanine symporter family protein [Citrobacter sp. BDA59-3]|uniref:alanine/glycine:cation symporter family protein n=1 Tax=Citrobacter sp. BDA59-3 TaxID=2781952 RepID=UPI00188084D8|nr:sodium:alanine symporter family protein [Citrobacter sp. BDA59-3]QOV69461.1 sodium:alanine symporter family protein [Citrobacter sp. BDA59-3]
MPEFFSFISEILWGSLMLYLLLAAGIWFAFKSKFVPFRLIGDFYHNLKHSRAQSGGLTSYQALFLSLAGRMGSGNLAGVALAITAGGPGAIFWMWISALIGMATCFAESTLAQLYKERDANQQFRGGPAWYMARGLGMRWMGVLFSVFLLLVYGLLFNTIQANSVANAVHFAWHFNEIYTGLIFAGMILLLITKSMKQIARIMQWVVPIMALAWVMTSVGIGIAHFTALPEMFANIVKSAFGWQEAAAGTMGYTLSQALTNGFQRSMYSNEAGMGSTPNAAAAAASSPPHPAAQGFVQMVGVIVDTFLVCTASAFILLLAKDTPTDNPIIGVQIVQEAMVALTGSWGASFVAVIIIMFAFNSIIANYVYAENNLIFLRMNSRRNIWLLRIGILLMVLIGSQLRIPLLWHVADVMMAFMAITNMTAILLLSPVVTLIAADYLRQRKMGVMPVFDPKRYPDINQQLAPGAWDDKTGS